MKGAGVRQAQTTRTEQTRKPKLLDRLRAEIRVRHYSIRTEHSYCDWVKRYCCFHQLRLETIPLRKLRLPFDPAGGDFPAAAFLEIGCHSPAGIDGSQGTVGRRGMGRE